MDGADDERVAAMVLRAAVLSKITLSEAEKEQEKWDLKHMLDCLDRLKELDTEGIEPMCHVLPMGNVLRGDRADNGDDREHLMRNAPRSRDGLFVVPETF